MEKIQKQTKGKPLTSRTQSTKKNIQLANNEIKKG